MNAEPTEILTMCNRAFKTSKSGKISDAWEKLHVPSGEILREF